MNSEVATIGLTHVIPPIAALVTGLVSVWLTISYLKTGNKKFLLWEIGCLVTFLLILMIMITIHTPPT